MEGRIPTLLTVKILLLMYSWLILKSCSRAHAWGRGAGCERGSRLTPRLLLTMGRTTEKCVSMSDAHLECETCQKSDQLHLSC